MANDREPSTLNGLTQREQLNTRCPGPAAYLNTQAAMKIRWFNANVMVRTRNFLDLQLTVRCAVRLGFSDALSAANMFHAAVALRPHSQYHWFHRCRCHRPTGR